MELMQSLIQCQNTMTLCLPKD